MIILKIFKQKLPKKKIFTGFEAKITRFSRNTKNCDIFIALKKRLLKLQLKLGSDTLARIRLGDS